MQQAVAAIIRIEAGCRGGGACATVAVVVVAINRCESLSRDRTRDDVKTEEDGACRVDSGLASVQPSSPPGAAVRR